MRPEGLAAIEQQGLYVVDTDGDNTKLHNIEPYQLDSFSNTNSLFASK